MSKIERNYLLERAEAECRAAEFATSPEAARVHREMAGHYMQRLNDGYGSTDTAGMARE